MKYELYQKRYTAKQFERPINGRFNNQYHVYQEIGTNVHNQLEQALTHSLMIIDLRDGKCVLNLGIVYHYVISDIDKIDLDFFERIIFESANEFMKEYAELVKNHFFRQRELIIDIDPDQYLAAIKKHLSSNLN